MRLQGIQATPHPLGNRVDIRWRAPHGRSLRGVRLVRRERTHPTSATPTTPHGGVVVADVALPAPLFGLDPTLRGELGDGPISPALRQGFADNRIILAGRASVSTLRPAGQWRIHSDGVVYLLVLEGPALTVHDDTPAVVEDTGLQAGTVYYYMLFPYRGTPPVYLHDRRNRSAAMATARHDMAGQMYRQLPAIYHRYDTALPDPTHPASARLSAAERQQGQLRRFLEIPGSQLDQLQSFAGAVLDLHDVERVDGRLLPLLAQWIGWETDHRLELDARRNEIRAAPHIYRTIGIIPTVEATVKRLLGWESRTKEFVHNVCLSQRPERLTLRVQRRIGDADWVAEAAPLSLDWAYQGRISSAQLAGQRYLIYHAQHRMGWSLRYKTTTATDPGLADWSPSQPLTHRRTLDRHPSAVAWRGRLWVFWEARAANRERWSIDYRVHENGDWSGIQSVAFPGAGLVPIRRQPWAVVDNADRLWLFWLEFAPGDRWRIVHGVLDDDSATPLSPATATRAVGDDATVPEADIHVLFHAASARLWLFWSYRARVDGQTRWRIGYRRKASLDPASADWEPVQQLPDAGADGLHGDREPAAMVRSDNAIGLFWSSNREGSWSIWETGLDAASTAPLGLRRISDNPYSQRAPLPISLDGATLLCHRSNEGVRYTSGVYSATETEDNRYAGCTTVDTRNVAKIALRGQYHDFQTYIYDAGDNGRRGDANWYARDTVGLYLTPTTEDPARIVRERNLLRDALQQFLPAQVRAVLIIESRVHRERFYPPGRPMGEAFVDRLDASATETLPVPVDTHADTAPGWTWLRTWSAANPDHRTTDVAVAPIDTRFRIFHIGLTAGG